ncbi:Pyrroline-5-carboxylate reductase [hydrothermal vent metagenome]|uniref:Pyrroline-5-carboxylate reductase n=1 Tax=hydrothermal vent metagenome TaxID=652676 RepID=A0A3B0T3U8_9ZZZZ
MSLAEISSLALIGAGKMGGALLQGWLKGGLNPGAVTLIDPAPGAEILDVVSEHNLDLKSDPGAMAPPEIVVIAIKPQVMGEVLPGFGDMARGGATFVSVAAGQTIADIERVLGTRARVVRAMPNTPAAVGAGISVLVANVHVPSKMRCRAEALMASVGEVRWIDDEGLMDAVTALSGSGPAYVFYLVQAMAAAGEAAGLGPDLAMDLARQTVVGGGALLGASPLGADVLRQNVTSPGGTTAAALEVLMGEDGLTPLMTRAVAAAKRRGEELAG